MCWLHRRIFISKNCGVENMNWAGNLIQKEISKNDTVIELGCGIMQHLLDFVPTYHKTRLRCKSLSGMDINQEYLDFLNKK